MVRALILVIVGGLVITFTAEEPMCRLPEPDYARLDSDPAWLAYGAQFHGHLGPWATAGTRLGMAGVREAGAKGYFDVEVTCEGPLVEPPQSCFLDGLQVATGATVGKRNLHWVRSEEILVRVRNTRTGREVEVRPTAKLVELLGSFKPQRRAKGAEEADHDEEHGSGAKHSVEAIARRIAAMPDGEILTVSRAGE
jgi:formylmethanofuran dehydrogenase subunit E